MTWSEDVLFCASAGAVSEYGQFACLDTLGCDFHVDEVRFLVVHGILVERQTEFAELEYAVVASNVLCRFRRFCKEPCATLALPAGASSNKLDWMLQLVRDGWVVKYAVDLVPYTHGAAKEFGVFMVNKSVLYFKCLSIAGDLLERGCGEIRHNMPHFYYDCLLNIKDLHGFHALPNFEDFGNEQFRQTLNGQAVVLRDVDAGGFGDPAKVGPFPRLEAFPSVHCRRLLRGVPFGETLTVVVRLPLRGHRGLVMPDDDPPSEGEVLPPIADMAPPAVELVPVVVHEALGAPLGGDVLAEACRPVSLNVGGRRFHVKFDFFSHSSGIQRGYVSCLNPDHRACYRYTQVNKFPTRRALVAYLMVWSELGIGISRQDHQDPDLVVPAARQAELANLLGG